MANAFILPSVADLFSLSVFIIGFNLYYKTSLRKWLANAVAVTTYEQITNHF